MSKQSTIRYDIVSYGFLLVCYYNFVPIRPAVFEIFDFDKCHDLEIQVTQGLRNRHRSNRRLLFPINVPQQLLAYLVQFPRKSAISDENRKFPRIFCVHAKGFPCIWVSALEIKKKTRVMGLPGRTRSFTISSAV